MFTLSQKEKGLLFVLKDICTIKLLVSENQGFIKILNRLRL